ncbi:MAG: hypothetical protein ACREVN_11825 [Gammaproteobacteria bacterium]
MSTAPEIPGPARILFAAGIIGLGLQNLILTDFLWLEPVPAWLPARKVWASATGIALILASLSILVDRKTRPGAGALGLVLFLWALVLHLPILIREPGNGGAWGTAFKIIALAGAAWLLAAVSTDDRGSVDRRESFVSKMATPARVGFGIALLVFGILHFVYHDYIASLIPAWIPGSAYWPWFTGVAHIATGASILTTVKGHLGATLLGLMYGLWALMLHMPRVAADADNAQEWTDLFMAVALCGGALLVAGSMPVAGRNRGHEIGPTASESSQ